MYVYVYMYMIVCACLEHEEVFPITCSHVWS
jgi:hypothetical protein